MGKIWGVVLLIVILVPGCSNMKVSDFKDVTPKFSIENFFIGRTHASGIFEDRFGNLKRQFLVNIMGTWNGSSLILDEKFEYDDGEKDRRVWNIKKLNDHFYEGNADDVIGLAIGESYGNVLNWRYQMDLKTRFGLIRVDFDDWMFLQPSGIVINKAKVSKFGIDIGTVTLVFVKPDSYKKLNESFNHELKDVSVPKIGSIQ